MEYTKDFIYDVRYEKEAYAKLGWTSKFIKGMTRHKLITSCVTIGVLLVLADVGLMVNFLSLLNHI